MHTVYIKMIKKTHQYSKTYKSTKNHVQALSKFDYITYFIIVFRKYFCMPLFTKSHFIHKTITTGY